MTFKVLKSSPLGQQITALFHRIQESNAACHAFARRWSDLAKPNIIIRHGYLAGALSAIEFSQPPADKKAWSKFNHKEVNHRHYYFPSALEMKRSTSEIRKEVVSFTPIGCDELNSLFGLKSGSAGGLTWYVQPGITDCPDLYLVNIADEWALTRSVVSPDLIEILASEAITLASQARSSQPG